MLVNSSLSPHLIVEQEALRTMCARVASEDQEVHSTQKGERQERGQNIVYKYMRRLRYEVNNIYIYIYTSEPSGCS